VAYYHHVSQIQPPQEEDGDTIEEQTEKFEEAIGQRVSAESRAEQLMRASLIARGIDPDAKPVLSPELAAKLEEDAMKSDKDLFFSGVLDSGKEFKGKKIDTEHDTFE
jgi:hypothetical protein